MRLTSKNIVLTLIISIFFFIFVYQYKESRREEIENALFEHALVAVEPMWNFNIEKLDNYLEAVAQKYNYKTLKIINESGDIFYQTKEHETTRFEKFLIRWGLIPERQMEKRVVYKQGDTEEILGKIVVIWQDNSIYVISYVFLVSLLLIVIVNLYSGILRSKKALEDKVLLVVQQMKELSRQKKYIEDIFNVVPEGLVTFDPDYKCIEVNQSFNNILTYWASILNEEIEEVKDTFLAELCKQLQKSNQGQYIMHIGVYSVHIEFTASPVPSYDEIEKVVSLRDITKIASLERQLVQAQKLEAVGRLAAGIAHEINTPTQYVLTNLDFIKESHLDIAKAISKIESLCGDDEDQSSSDMKMKVRDSFTEADWEYLEEEIPKALEQSLEGLRRVSSIVVAMKNFSHPSGENAERCDINEALESTATVARNEWKYAANLDLQLQPALPLVPCYLDQLNQVFLNIIVNSAHAIEEKFGKHSEKKGKIKIRTTSADEKVIITISDDGIGMEKNVREKIFDPFFTTKELNKGTGQGLAIAHDVIVNRHEGNITVDSEPGAGTTFTIELPVQLSEV